MPKYFIVRKKRTLSNWITMTQIWSDAPKYSPRWTTRNVLVSEEIYSLFRVLKRSMFQVLKSVKFDGKINVRSPKSFFTMKTLWVNLSSLEKIIPSSSLLWFPNLVFLTPVILILFFITSTFLNHFIPLSFIPSHFKC